jgi:signal transduction histidine kinase
MVERIQLLLSSIREITDNIAHDLRSPVARLRGRAEIALTRSVPHGREAGDLPEETLAEETLEECDRLLAMINTMLDISELEAGTARIEADTVDLGELVHDTRDLFEPVAEAAGITLRAEAEPGHTIRGDVNGLQRALGNVVDNALKYTPEGGSVMVRLRPAEGAMKITVQDTGVGIPEEESERIFDRFYRGDRSRSQQGSGLGLSLARALVRAQGGDITLKSRVGEGTKFTLLLPGIPPRSHGNAELTNS